MQSRLMPPVSAIEWEERFIQAGCDTVLFKQVYQTKVIEDYKKLLKAFTNLPISMREDFQEPWQLFVLSGEKKAFEYALNPDNTKIKPMNKDSKSSGGENALHYAALCQERDNFGAETQLDRALKLGIPFDSVSNLGFNIIHYVVLGTQGQMLRVNDLKSEYSKKTEKDLSLIANDNVNVFHLAAFSGNLFAYHYAKNVILASDLEETIVKLHQKTFNSECKPLHATDLNGFNALHYAEKRLSLALTEQEKNSCLKIIESLKAFHLETKEGEFRNLRFGDGSKIKTAQLSHIG